MNFHRPAPRLFIPPANRAARIVREGRLIKDLSMQLCDWRAYDAPTVARVKLPTGRGRV